MKSLRRVACLGALLATAGCADFCGNEVASRHPAPDGRRFATIFQRDCGATSGFSTQISILRSGDEVSGAGNVFIADDDQGAAVAGPWKGSWAEVQWLTSDRLLVRYASKSHIFKRTATIDGVTVEYEEVAP